MITRLLQRLRRQPRIVVLAGQSMPEPVLQDALRLAEGNPTWGAVHALLDQQFAAAVADSLNVARGSTALDLAHAQGRAAALAEFKAELQQRQAAAKGGAR